MSTPPVWYVAHPVGAPTVEGVLANLERAERWLRWLILYEPDIAFSMPWLPYLRVLSDADAAMRARGLRDDCAMVARCDGIVLCGGRVSDGMQQELDRFLITRPQAVSYDGVADLIALGDEPPVNGTAPHPIEFGRAQWHHRVSERKGAVRYA